MNGKVIMWRGLILLTVILTVFGHASSMATAATKASVHSANGQPIALEINEGQLIRLPKPATSVFIANVQIADVSVKSPRLVYVFGLKPGETTLFAVDQRENVIADMRIEVSHNLSRLNMSLSRLMPSGGVTAISIDGGIVLSGEVANSADADNVKRIAQRFIAKDEEVINRLVVTTPHQVNLRVRIAEVARDVIKEFGINWDLSAVGAMTFGIATGNPLLAGTLAGVFTLSPPEGSKQFLTRRDTEQNSLFFRATPGPLDINALIDAMSEDGLVSVLAEPNLTALTGETATFLAGGEFPIAISEDDEGITFAFKEFGVSLAFTPTVVNGNRISMRVRPEVSQLSNAGAIVLAGFQVPALTVRRAETTVELASGQSFAIAGMLLDRKAHDVDSVPGLSSIPILGELFRSDRFQREETELVIIVTPYLVRPVSDPNLLSSPDRNGMQPRNTAVSGNYPPAARHTVPLAASNNLRPGLVGPAGFMID